MGLVETIKDNDWRSVRSAIAKLASIKLGPTAEPTFAGQTIINNISITDVSNISAICTVAAGLNVLRVTGLQTDDVAMSGTLRGAYIDVSNGNVAATGTIRGMELKARTEAPGDIGSDVAVLEGLSISVDSKDHSVTTMRAAEFILDGVVGGTIGEAVGLRIANNLQDGKATFSYGLQIYRDSFDYTYDIVLSLGGYITGDSYINQDLRTTGTPTFAGLNMIGYMDLSDIADPGAPAASKSRLFSNSGHAISIAPGDVWHDLSMGGLGTSSCIHDAITITHVGDSGLNITWSAGTVFDAAITGGNQLVTIAAQPANQACTANSVNYLFFDHSGGILVLNTSGPDYSDGDFSIAHILTTHDNIFEIFYRPIDKEVTHNIKWALREAFPNVIVSGLVVSAHADGDTFDVDQSAGSFVHGGFSLKTASLIDSTETNIIRWYHNADNDWETDTDSQIDNANWDDDDDDLTVKGTSSGKYYRSVFVTCGDCIHWVYPQVEYANLAAALAGIDPILPAVLEHLPKTTVLIMKHNDAAFPVVGSDQWIDVRPMLGVVSTGASIADHGSLTGLGDDDHVQYIKDAEFTQDSGVLVGIGEGTFQEETGDTLRTSLGLTIGTDVQAYFASRVSVYRNAAQSIPDITPTKIWFDTGIYDNNDEFTGAIFTAKTEGYYHIIVQTGITSLAADKYIDTGIYKNGESIISDIYMTSFAGSPRHSFSKDVFLEVNDTIEVYIYHNHGAARYLTVGPLNSSLCIHRFA